MFSGILAILLAVQWGYVPEPQLKVAVRGFGPRCACRTDEVRVLIDGVHVAGRCGRTSLVIVDNLVPAGIVPLEPWRVVVPADYFLREMVLSGEWIETRPRLHGPR